MKTNKSLTKRLKVTKNGKILARRPGINHFNAKESRRGQLAKRTTKKINLSPKLRSQFIPFTK